MKCAELNCLRTSRRTDAGLICIIAFDTMISGHAVEAIDAMQLDFLAASGRTCIHDRIPKQTLESVRSTAKAWLECRGTERAMPNRRAVRRRLGRNAEEPLRAVPNCRAVLIVRWVVFGVVVEWDELGMMHSCLVFVRLRIGCQHYLRPM